MKRSCLYKLAPLLFLWCAYGIAEGQTSIATYSLVQKYAAKYNVPAPFTAALIDVESGWNPRAVSDKGARGLMQLMPGTARTYGAFDPFDPDQNIAAGTRYVVMLVGFLWEMYQAASQGGDVKGFGRSAAKYLACALVVQAWPQIFTEVNQAFVNAGSWMTGQGGASNVLDTWMQQIQAQYNQDGFQHMWNLITGAVSGLLDAILIFVAYLLYPIVTIIFGFFYMLMGSILYIFGPLVIALLPVAPANRLAKSYIEHVFIWNAWPILYGGLGLLVSLVNIGNVQNILNAQDFLGGLNGVEGSILAGIISIVYSIAIAVIPFMARSIVSGDVGSAARSMMSAATTALGTSPSMT